MPGTSFETSGAAAAGVGRAPRTSRLFGPLCVLSVTLILACYVLLVTSNAIYLGWSDGLYFLGHPRMWQRLGLTVWTAAVATATTLVVGVPAGYALSRLRLPWPQLMATLVDLPVMLPPAAVGAFMLGLTASSPARLLLGDSLDHSVAGVIAVQFVVTVAFCARLMKASFDAVNPRLEQVARSLGAGRARAFATVTLPLAGRGIVASAAVVWARAAAEWEALMLFVGATQGRTDIMPLAVYLDWNGAMMGWVVSMSLVCVLLAVATMGAVRIIGGRSHVW